MPRVSQETMEKLSALIDSLPVEARSKCALCNETLTHIVKMAEAQTGAGTATVARALADKINDGAAAAGDRVSGKHLQDRVRYNEGKDKIGNSENKPATQQPTDPTREPEHGDDLPDGEYVIADNGNAFSEAVSVANGAMHFATSAICQLERIMGSDPFRDRALQSVIEYCQNKIRGSHENLSDRRL